MIQLFSEILSFRAKTHPERIALISESVNYTYADLYNHALSVASWLHTQNIVKGDHVAILDFNNAAYVHLVNGCIISGVIPVSINWRLTIKEMEFIVNDSNAKLFIYGDAFSKQAGELISLVQITGYTLQTLFNKIISQPAANNFSLPNLELDEQTLLVYTSGTTGNPKGVVLSNRNIFEMYYALRSETPLFGAASINLIVGPWYAVVGIGYFIFGVFTGCTNVLLQLFDPIEVLRLIEKYKVTNAFFAPIMMKIICAMEEVQEYNLSSLQNIQYGGSLIEAEQLRICYSTFKCNFTQGYGLTETSGIATALRFDDHLRIINAPNSELDYLLHSAGKPYPGVTIKIADEHNSELPFNNIGEVCIKGAIVAMGYKNKHSDFDKMFNANGWFYTGDMGYINEAGYLFLVDRKNDMIISKGQNIYPAEIEHQLILHPNIKDVVAIGVPHEIYGEAVGVIVTLNSGNLDISTLRNWAIEKLPEFKLPISIEVVNELPRNATGKVLRKVLREKYWTNKNRRIN